MPRVQTAKQVHNRGSWLSDNILHAMFGGPTWRYKFALVLVVYVAVSGAPSSGDFVVL